MTNEQTIYNEAKRNGMPELLALFIVAQAKHETANFTSNVFLSCNNAFGYKYVGQRLAVGPCLTSPELDAYAKYATVADSVKELCQWIQRRQTEGKFPLDLRVIKTLDHYTQLLKLAGYFGAPISEYLAGLLYWFKPFIKPIIGGGLVILAAMFFFLYKAGKLR